ncbi:serine protease [Streptosporangium sp. NPDC048047]|uniref:trypsin-like serine peptidase n=1 Tax=Streptosporangium sp. NPDC048047 TaxID=3155748 RepID=UPI003444FF22
MNPRARRLAIPLTGALMVTGVIGATSGAQASASPPSDVVSSSASETPVEATSFWSPERMRRATDASRDLDLSVRGGTASKAAGQPDGKAGSVPPIGQEGGRSTRSRSVNLPNTVGRVFFTLPGSNPADPKSWKYCSGSSIQGRYRNLVATSAHCVYDVKSNKFYDNWVFIPSYWDGDQAWNGKNPYGIYAAKWFNAHDDFVVKEDYDFDYAFVNVSSGYKVDWEKGTDGKWKPAIKNVGRLGDNVGGQGFAWNQKVKNDIFSFGYPAGLHPNGDKPFSGRTMKWCYGTAAAMPAAPQYNIQEHVGFRCAFTAGASGGPWLLKYKNSTRTGYINGVNSVAWDTDKNDRYDRISSPYFDTDTYKVYRTAANRWTG